jgi:hypothetical protein
LRCRGRKGAAVIDKYLTETSAIEASRRTCRLVLSPLPGDLMPKSINLCIDLGTCQSTAIEEGKKTGTILLACSE